MKYLSLVLFILLASCGGGSSSSSSTPVNPPDNPPTDPQDPPPEVGEITINGLTALPASTQWQQSYSIQLNTNSTYTSSKNVTVELFRYDEFFNTTVELSPQTVSIAADDASVELVTGTNLWEWGFNGRPSANHITYTAIIDEVEYEVTVTLNGRSIGIAN